MLASHKIILITTALFSIFSTHQSYADTSCEIKRPIIFGGLDWDSAQFHNAVARYILEKGYSCKTDELPGSSMPILAGMVRGDIDIMMEVWPESTKEAWTKALKSKKVVQLTPNFGNATQGWFVPRYLVEGDPKRGIKPMAPDLKHVRDLVKYKLLFKDPEEPTKGRFHNCILGWFCEVINNKKLVAYGLDKHFNNLRPGTGAALDAAITSSYKRGKPFVTYYWAPTWIMGTYDMIQLEEPAYNQADFEAFEAGDPKRVTAYPTVDIYKGMHTKFHDKAPQITKFINAYKTTAKLTSDALSYLKKKRGTSHKKAAINFLRTNPKLWKQWVSTEVATKVQQSLNKESPSH